MFVIGEEVLERLTCFRCKKYLSVKPIKVYPNRGISCGRCSKAADAGVVSLFGIIAEQALFRCVNRFEGCNRLLHYSDVEEHEKKCFGMEYECLCCAEPFKGSGYEMYIHFKEQHADQLLVNTTEFVLEIDNELLKTYLYRKSDLLFYINAIYNRGEGELILNTKYFGTEQDASKITQMFTLQSLGAQTKHKTKKKSCCSVNGGNLNGFKINISTDDFSKNIIVCRLNLNTENVENLLALPEDLKGGKTHLGSKENVALSNNIIKPPTFGKGSTELFGQNPFRYEGPQHTRFFNTIIGQQNTNKPVFECGSTQQTSSITIFGHDNTADVLGGTQQTTIFGQQDKTGHLLVGTQQTSSNTIFRKQDKTAYPLGGTRQTRRSNTTFGQQNKKKPVFQLGDTQQTSSNTTFGQQNKNKPVFQLGDTQQASSNTTFGQQNKNKPVIQLDDTQQTSLNTTFGQKVNFCLITQQTKFQGFK